MHALRLKFAIAIGLICRKKIANEPKCCLLLGPWFHFLEKKGKFSMGVFNTANPWRNKDLIG
jgi:hypothetical protein